MARTARKARTARTARKTTRARARAALTLDQLIRRAWRNYKAGLARPTHNFYGVQTTPSGDYSRTTAHPLYPSRECCGLGAAVIGLPLAVADKIIQHERGYGFLSGFEQGFDDGFDDKPVTERVNSFKRPPHRRTFRAAYRLGRRAAVLAKQGDSHVHDR